MTLARTCLAVAVLFLSTVTMQRGARGDLVVNGSFENATGGLPDNWTATGNLTVVSSQGKTDGANAVAFSFGNVPSTGALSQALATTAATSYRVAFDFGKYSINQPLEVARLQVEVFDGLGFGGIQLLNQVVTDDTPAGGEPNSTDSPSVYSGFQLMFTAASANATLRFTDTSDPQSIGGGFDAMLDNVRVTAVPEPCSGALLIPALLALRRRRRA